MKEQEKEKSPGLLVKGTSYFLIYLTGIYPLNSAVAGGITPDNTQTQIQHNGNVPVVNIVAPNSAGISHNTYKEFNTGTQGAVLNNATQAVNSQLAGQINANANLQGKAAELIINEVTGSSRSELLGQLEVAGQKANVMIANPNGITCDGCGFINTSGAILTTGKPQFDTQGALDALTVTKGQITIGGKGLNGQSTDYVDIISRATELNGKIQANNLTLTQGANQISFKDGTAKTLAGEGAAPQLAVDTKALGGMYAHKIRLVATEDGVGVNLNNLTSTQQDITLSASGKITLGSIQAKTDLNVGAKAIQIAVDVPVQAERNIVLAGDSLENKGRVTAGQDMRLYSEKVSNIGAQALLQANNNLWVQKNAAGEKNTAVENKSGTIKTNSGDIIIRTQRLNNERENLQITPHTQQVNVESKIKEGSVDFTKPIYIDVPHNDTKLEYTNFSAAMSSNPAVIESGNNAYLYGDNLLNKSSNISAKQNLILTGTHLESNGTALGVLEKYKEYFGAEYVKDILSKDVSIWKSNGILASTLRAGNNLVADFKETIQFKDKLPDEASRIDQIISDNNQISLNAKNILLNAKDIDISTGINADNDITMIADNTVKTSLTTLTSGENVAITALGNINVLQSQLKSKNIALMSHLGELAVKNALRAFYSDNTRWLNKIEASGELNLSAGKNIDIKDTLFSSKSHNIAFNAGKDITIEHSDEILNHHNVMQPLPVEKEAELFKSLSPLATLNASGSILMNSGENLSLNRVNLEADKDIELYVGNDFNHYITAINPKSFRISTITKAPDLQAHIRSGNNLLINAQHDITLEGSDIITKGSASLLAGNSINLLSIPYSFFKETMTDIMNHFVPFKKPPVDMNYIITTIKADKDIHLTSGGKLLTEAAKLSVNGNIIAFSDDNMSFESLTITERSYSKNTGLVEKIVNEVSELTAGGLLKLATNGSILFEATKLTAKGLGAIWKDPVPVSNHSGPVVNAESNVRSAQEKLEIIQREKTPVEKEVNDLKLAIEEVETNINHFYATKGKNDKSREKLAAFFIEQATKENREKLAPKLVQLTEIEARLTQAKHVLETASQQLARAKQDAQAKGDSEAKLQADIEAHNYAEAMRIGTIDVAAKGGYLYAKAQQHSEKREITRKSAGGFFSSGKTTTEISQKTGHDVSEFVAAGNLTMLSHGDSTYEASKIEAGKHIRLISTHGKVNFTAMPNTSFEQITSSSKGLFIKQAGRGHDNTTWTLPSITAGSLLTVEANGGIHADVKTQKGQSLQTALTVLGENPDTAWLKDLTTRQDVQWNEVQDAYANWDYSHQQLNPVAAAVIAIAVAAVTAGSGLVVAAGASTASAATGVGAATAATATTTGAVVSGATIAGISSLASKAAVTLVNNQGNLSKTFKDLGNSDTVKSTITSMAIGGALAGFDQAMGWSTAKEGVKEGADAAASAKSNIPLLSQGADWSQVAKRVAGQSIISSGLNTGINGGSFKDNFATALLSNVGNQINAEGANVIGDYGKVLGDPGKAIGHAAVSAIAAHIGGGDARGAAAGALAAELGALTLAKTFNDPAQVLASGKIIGGIAGAFATNSAEGVNSGANASEIVLEYNFFLHDLMELDKEVKAAKQKGEDTASIIEKARTKRAEERESVKAECLDKPTMCSFELSEFANQALEYADTLSGRLYFDKSVIAFTFEETAKDNAILEEYTNGAGQILMYALNGAKSLSGEETRFSMTGKSIRTNIHNPQANQHGDSSKGPVYIVDSGKKRAWDTQMNNPEPNATYHVDGNKTYRTDSLSRPVSVEASLTLSTNDRNTYQQRKMGHQGNPGDDGGHLIGSIFNGPGEKLNMVPMNASLNRHGDWRNMERSWHDALKSGKTVDVKIQPIYTDNSKRPVSFDVTYKIGGEAPIQASFNND
ncbi:DUF637 domain-containing protein [Xenorhabdus innexi]|uniref:ShlA/HecA/FhaA exofamily protein n=1 Tax=Xenorhabdus innexi TaxID=290109 RepID=A0A1N6MUI8_9GAMM|nr:DUF637 domain-containing protein [Xenorhabdus innexi]PHM29423.1 ShlA/HecA/FhaA exofamily protein [Xenorhabdus innexi]SIP72480.1 conserved hypothetical protein [Xenorhabdus innexi]